MLILSNDTINLKTPFGQLIYIREAQPFRYCRPHYIYFYELRPPVSSVYFIFCIASVLLSHTEPTLFPHVCLAFFLLYTHTADKEFSIIYQHNNFYILNYVIMCTATKIFIEGHMRPYVVHS